MSARNYHVHNSDPEVLKTLAEEYEDMGRDTKIEGTRLTVFARKVQRVEKKKTRERKEPTDGQRSKRERS